MPTNRSNAHNKAYLPTQQVEEYIDHYFDRLVALGLSNILPTFFAFA